MCLRGRTGRFTSLTITNLFCELEGLDIERTDLDSAVYEIARIHLDERWLASVADRWSEHDELPDGKRAMLKKGH